MSALEAIIVTASKVGLLQFCKWWARQDAVRENRSGPSAERGTRFHQAIAAYTDTRQRVEVAEDIREIYAAACDWIDSLQIPSGGSLRTEVAFAWDPATDTAEVIPAVERDYQAGAGRLCGTADLVMVVSFEGRPAAIIVWDWKTGDGSGAGPQLRTLGLMASRAFGVDEVSVAALEARASGVTEVAREELDAFALAGVAGELAEQIAAIPTAEPSPGSHCGELYCPARLSCPLGTAATAEVVQVIPAESLVARQSYRITDPIRTAEHAIWTVDVLRLMSAWIEAKKDEIKALVPPEGWAAEDGRVLKETKSKVEAFDKGKAIALCKELGATDEQLGRLFYDYERSNGLRVTGGGAKPRAKRTRAA
jgi:hypothetical protein